MGTLIAIGLIIGAVVGAMMWAGKKAGDAVSGKAATEALKDVTDANRPAESGDLDRMRDKYRRS